MGGKRDGTTTPPKDKEDKETAAKEISEAHAHSEPTAVSDEAPKLDKPVPAEPLKIETEEVCSVSSRLVGCCADVGRSSQRLLLLLLPSAPPHKLLVPRFR